MLDKEVFRLQKIENKTQNKKWKTKIHFKTGLVFQIPKAGLEAGGWGEKLCAKSSA